ncbi:hypothetical protein ACFL3V_06060 [Nanoarchaeota archaeon]
MRIAGLPRRINGELGRIHDVKRYYKELAANPSYIKTGEVDYLLDSIKDDGLREVLVYIGKHNVLPDSDIRGIINGDYAQSYADVWKAGWANLKYLLEVVNSRFMPDANPSQISYTRQVALYCKGCGEYKATGMFKATRKDKSYDAQIDFKEEHFIDPNRIRELLVKPSGKRKRQRVKFCVPCGSVSRKLFERRYEGLYASAREYAFNQTYLDSLIREGRPLPKVLSVNIRTKEPGREAEKLAYQLSGKKKGKSKHFAILEKNRPKLEEIIGEEEIDLLLSDAENSIFDKFGIRLITSTVDDCYELMEWFKAKGELTRSMDYIKEPKPNNYQSLHATFVSQQLNDFSELEIPIDLQIRTQEMHKIAEKGSAARGPDKGRRELVDHKLFLAMTAFRYHLFGA